VNAAEYDVLTSKSDPSKVSHMRTTLTLDDDLAGLLKRRAQDLGVPFKEAVNRAIRAGLSEAAADRRGAAPQTIPHSFGFMPGIDVDKLGQLADELEAEAVADKIHDFAGRQRPRSRAQR
jgi:hypothetical protein